MKDLVLENLYSFSRRTGLSLDVDIQIIERIFKEHTKQQEEIDRLTKRLEESQSAYLLVNGKNRVALERCDYLLNNDKVKINDKEYIKQEADNVITQYIKDSLIGSDKEW